MVSASDALRALVDEFQKLPGIGAKSAERLAYFVLRAPEDEAIRLADAIRRVKAELRPCSICSNVASGDRCPICSDATRDPSTICVVEDVRDLLAIEQSGSYRGVYHVLQGVFSPLDGVTPEDLTTRALLGRVRSGGVSEVILATNPNFEGEGTALLLERELRALPVQVRVTRIARGVPSGSQLEHAARNTVADALEGRREMRSGT